MQHQQAWLVGGSAATVAWFAASPSPASLLAMWAAVSVGTYAALPSAWAAAAVVAASCATGLAAPGSTPSCALAAAQLGAVAFLLGRASLAVGAATTDWAAAVLGGVCAVMLVAVALQHTTSQKKSGDTSKDAAA